jgi:exosortase
MFPMPAFWKNLRATVPGPFLAALVLGVLFLAFVAWDQSYWWRIKEDYSFGWLVPVFVIFVVHDRWAKIIAGLGACGAAGSPRATGADLWVLRLALGAALLFGVLMFLLGAFYRAANGTSQPGTLALTLGAVGLLLPILFLNAPVSPSPAPSSLLGDARVKLVALFVFPLLVWLVSAPMVSAIEIQINLALLRQVVKVVAFVFDTLGLPVEQQGNVLVLPTGSVGVEDACSGIRSLTGCLFAGSFLGAVFVEKLWKKIALITTALLLAFVTNLARSLFLTGWAYHYGPQAIEGKVHDAAGYAVLGLTVVGLLCLVPLLNLKLGAARPGAARSAKTPSLA